MKNLIFLFVLFLIFSSCKKEEFVPESEIPAWLKDQIQGYELVLQQNPKNPVLNGTAWIRYKWNDEYYFEFRSMISSSFAFPISFQRDTLKVCAVCEGVDYHDNKCCKQYVWKGAGYPDSGD